MRYTQVYPRSLFQSPPESTRLSQLRALHAYHLFSGLRLLRPRDVAQAVTNVFANYGPDTMEHAGVGWGDQSTMDRFHDDVNDYLLGRKHRDCKKRAEEVERLPRHT